MNIQRLNVNNEDQRREAYLKAREVVSSFYTSNMYAKKWALYESRRNAYYQKHETTAPAWRSKLYLATFFQACKSLDAQFKSSHSQDPFVWVNLSQDSVNEEGAAEKARIAHIDLNYDLDISNFKESVLDPMYWYVEIFGTACGREYFRVDTETKRIKKRTTDMFGNDAGIQETTTTKRKEYTCTDIIHPLNFAHEITKSGFADSEWGSVRFDMPIRMLYQMLNNSNYDRAAVERLIEKVEKQRVQISHAQDTFYCQNTNETAMSRRIVAEEFVGPVCTDYNKGDYLRYYMLWFPEYDECVRTNVSQFKDIPYWKMQCYPDPDGPYGVDPCAPILPINKWENATINQYNDYVSMVLSMMYEVQIDNIDGGLGMLLNGLPFGMIPLTEGTELGRTVAPLNTNRGSLGPASDTIQMIDKYKQELRATSNLRGRGEGAAPAANTLGGIQIMASREDEQIAMMQAGCDAGIKRAMQLKLQNSSEFFMEPRRGKISRGDEEQSIEYYPYEYGGLGFSLKVERKKADIEAGKHMSWFKMLGLLAQAGQASGKSIPFNVFVDEAAKVGRALGIDNTDESMQKILDTMQGPPTEIGGSSAPGMPTGGAAGTLGASAPIPEQQTQPPEAIPADVGAMAGAIG